MYSKELFLTMDSKTWSRRRKRRRSLVPILFCSVIVGSDTAFAADHHLRSTRRTNDLGINRERILPCSFELNEIESDIESLEARSRHRSHPIERNIFVHHTQTTASPSELPSTLPTNYDITSNIPYTIPSSTPSLTPTIVPSLSPTRIQVTQPAASIVPTLTDSNTEIPSSIIIDDDINDEDGFNITDSPSPSSQPIEGDGNSTITSIDKFLGQTISDTGEIDILGSPQNNALLAILNNTPELDPSNPEDQIEILQRYALNTLYFSTNGDSWKDNNMWTSASHPCGSGNYGNDTNINNTSQSAAWFGVLCDPTEEIIERLSLEGNDLRGGLPSEIQGLNGLQVLELNENQLSGSIPGAIGNLTKLTIFEVGTNFISGTVPTTIGSLSSMILLDISSNFLTGTLFTELGQLSKLTGLSIKSNFLGGSIPTELLSLSSMVSLDMDNNELSGSLPSEIGQLTNAISVSISGNSLTGIVPKEIVTLENLETFSANTNFVGGQLPDIFDKLFYLRSFDMAFNFLTGSLPPSLFYNASLLERLNLSGNTLGNELPLPGGLGQMKALQLLDLSINQFLGTIPGEITKMKSLKELRLDKNFLTGQLPTDFFQLSNIEILSLSENSLSVLPTRLIGFSKLRELQLSSNIIEELPEEYVNNFTNLEILNVSRNAIGGDDFPSRFQSTALTTVDFSFNNLNTTFNLSSLTGLVNIQNIHMASCSIQSSLPNDISVLQSLVTIDLDSNVFLEGTIPSSLGDISTLQKIILASNSLSGTIPVELAQLENLTIFELQFNSLTGTIPTEFGTLTNLETFNTTGNNITEAGNNITEDLNELND